MSTLCKAYCDEREAREAVERLVAPHRRREGAGTFAGNAGRQRKGSFGDVEPADGVVDENHDSAGVVVVDLEQQAAA